MGRTIPSWRMVVEGELEKLKRFRQFLRSEDKKIFDDLLNQCRLYASYGSTMALPVKEIPLLMSMLFGQHKRLMELERRVNSTGRRVSDPPESGNDLPKIPSMDKFDVCLPVRN